MTRKQGKNRVQHSQVAPVEPVRDAKPTPVSSSVSGSNRKYVVILLSITFIVFFNTVFNDYSVDDFYVIEGNEQALKGFAGVPEILTTHFVTFKGMGGSYRATGRASFAIEYGLFGLNPHLSHFFNLLFYILLVWLVFVFLYEIFGREKLFLIFCSALIYAVHPIHVEVVASLKSRDELFSSLFAFSACLLFIRYVKGSISLPLFAVGCLCFMLALMSKESAQQFLAVAPLAAFFAGTPLNKKLLAATCAFVLVSVCFWLFMIYGLPNTQLFWMSEVAEGYPFIEHPLAFVTDLNEKYGTAFYGLLYYVRLMFFPFPLSFFYGYDLIPIVGMTHPVSIISLLLYASAAVMAFYLLKRRHYLSFSILYIFITLSMFSNLLIQVSGIIADRYAFSASLGFCMIIAWIFLKIFKISPATDLDTARSKRLFSIVFIAFLAVFSIKTIQRNSEWKNKLSLSMVDAQRNPRSAVSNLYYAKELLAQLETGADSASVVPEAMKYLAKVIEIDPKETFSHFKSGQLYRYYYKDYRKAEYHFNQSISSLSGPVRYYDDWAKWIYISLAGLYELQGNKEAFTSTMDRLNKDYPEAPEPYFFHGSEAYRQEDMPKAIALFEKGVSMGGKNKDVFRILYDYYDQNNMKDKLDTLNVYMNRPDPE